MQSLILFCSKFLFFQRVIFTILFVRGATVLQASAASWWICDVVGT